MHVKGEKVNLLDVVSLPTQTHGKAVPYVYNCSPISIQPVKPRRKPNRLELDTGLGAAAGLGGRGEPFGTASVDDDPSFIEVARCITGACRLITQEGRDFSCWVLERM